MPRKRLTELPEGLWVKLAELEQYVRQLDFVRGLGSVLAVAALCIATSLVADLTLELPLALRIGLLVSSICLTLAALYGMLWRPWRRQRTDIDLASLVERAHPELKEGLVSCIELYDPAIPEQDRGSPLMRELSAKQALQQAAPLDFCDSISSRPAHRMAACGLVAWAILLLPLGAPTSYRLLFARFLTPWRNLDRVATFWFDIDQGDRVVVRGSDVTLTAQPRGTPADFPETVNLNWIDAQGESDIRKVDFDFEKKAYSTTIPHVMQDFQYYLTGAGNRSRNYTIHVVEAPAITAVTLQVQPPAYTGQPAKVLDGPPSEIEVLEQTGLRWKLIFNKPMVAAEWQWLSPGLVPNAGHDQPARLPAEQANAPAVDGDVSEKIKLVLSADKLSATWKTTATRSGEFRLVARDEYGLMNNDAATRVLTVTPDLAPTLSVSGSPEGETAQATDIVPIDAEAADDIGIAELELHVEVDAARKQVVKCPTRELGGTRLRYRFQLDLSSLQLKDGEMVGYRVRAADERPVPGPNETWSDQRMIRIDSQAKAPGTQELAAEQSQLQKFLKQLQEGVSQQQDNVEALQGDAQKAAEEQHPEEQQATRDRRDQIELAADEQARLQAKLEQLSKALSQHPLFANLTEKTRALSEQEFNAAQKAISDAEQAEAKPQAEQLQTASQQLANAEQKLANLDQQLNKLAQLERDLLELHRLAANAEKLAQQLKDIERQRQQPPPEETQQQRETRELLEKAEQNRLADQQKDLLQQAEKLLQKQPELAQASREQLNQQINQLTQQAEQLSQPQQDLADKLQQQAQDAASEHEGLAEQQAKLQQSIQDLQQKLAKAPQPGVQPIDPQQVQQALEELQAGNLGAAAEQEQRLAEQLDQLEQQLKDAEEQRAQAKQPANIARELARQQAEAARSAQAAAKKGVTEPNEQRASASEKLAERQAQLEKLPAGQAGEQKQAAADAMKKAAEAQRADPQDQQRALDKNAAAQQAAAEALQKFADQIAKQPPGTQVAANEKPENKTAPPANQDQPDQQASPDQQNQNAKTAGPQKNPGSNPEAEQARQLAAEAREMQKELEQAKASQDLRSPQAEQQELNDALAKLNEQIEAARQSGKSAEKPDQAANTQGLEKAQQAMEQAQQQLEEGNLEKAAAEARKSASALQPMPPSSPMQGSPTEAKQEAAASPMPGEGSSPMPGESKSQSPVPPQAASDVSNAVQQLQEALANTPPVDQSPQAGDQAQKPADQSSQKQPSPEKTQTPSSKPGEGTTGKNGASKAEQGNSPSASEGQGKTPGQPNQTQSDQSGTKPGGEASSGQSKDGNAQGKNSGQKSPAGPAASPQKSPVDEAAQRLQKAAEALRQAVAQYQKSNGSGDNQSEGNPDQQADASGNPQPSDAANPGQAKGPEAGPGNSANGSGKQTPEPMGDVDPELARLRKRLKGRKWGELPGTLQTEILQAAQKKPNSEYADLIRQYFKEIAKTQPAPKAEGK